MGMANVNCPRPDPYDCYIVLRSLSTGRQQEERSSTPRLPEMATNEVLHRNRRQPLNCSSTNCRRTHLESVSWHLLKKAAGAEALGDGP
jgi:hypothetical protein